MRYEIDEIIDSAWLGWTDGMKYLVATPEGSQLTSRPIDFIGTNDQILQWLQGSVSKVSTVYVLAGEQTVNLLKLNLPHMDIRSVPVP